MAFTDSLALVIDLEGGYVDNPNDPGGETNAGMTQLTWEHLGFVGHVWQASREQIASAYRRLWDSMNIYNVEANCFESVFNVLPDPADAVGFQAFINLPWNTFIKMLQSVLGVKPDGMLGPESFRAIEKFNGKGEELSELLLNAQELHYNQTAKPEFIHGLINRVKRVRAWLAKR